MIGTRVGPYRIERKLGQGGMGAVYEAVHETIERRVAIKVLNPQLAQNSDVSVRFINEQRVPSTSEPSRACAGIGLPGRCPTEPPTSSWSCSKARH